MEARNKTSDPLLWSDFSRLKEDLIKDKKYKLCMLVSLGCYTGLRHSDLIRITWNDILLNDKLQLIETKTKKLKRVREISINTDLKRIAAICRQDKDGELLILGGKFNSPESIQWHNKCFEKLKIDYPYLNIQNFTQHSTRKCFSLRVYEQLGSNENALITLQYLLKHSNSLITLAYLGLQRKIETNVYNNL
jgi:integrase